MRDIAAANAPSRMDDTDIITSNSLYVFYEYLQTQQTSIWGYYHSLLSLIFYTYISQYNNSDSAAIQTQQVSNREWNQSLEEVSSSIQEVISADVFSTRSLICFFHDQGRTASSKTAKPKMRTRILNLFGRDTFLGALVSSETLASLLEEAMLTSPLLPFESLPAAISIVPPTVLPVPACVVTVPLLLTEEDEPVSGDSSLLAKYASTFSCCLAACDDR